MAIRPPTDKGPNGYAKPANHKGPHRSDFDYGKTSASEFWKDRLPPGDKPDMKVKRP